MHLPGQPRFGPDASSNAEFSERLLQVAAASDVARCFSLAECLSAGQADGRSFAGAMPRDALLWQAHAVWMDSVCVLCSVVATEAAGFCLLLLYLMRANDGALLRHAALLER